MDTSRLELKLSAMEPGFHEYEYHVNDTFFSTFNSDLLSEGSVDVLLSVEKTASQLVLNFKFQGEVLKTCDRCLNELQYPIDHVYRLLAKLTFDLKDEEHDLIYISPNESKLDLRPFLWDYIVLSLPMQVTCSMSSTPKECDEVHHDNKELEQEVHPEFEKLKKLLKDN